MGHRESKPKRKIHSITRLCQKNNKKAQINNLTLKELEKEQQTKHKVSGRKEIIKIRAEIKEIQSKKLYKRSMNPRTCSLKK